MTIPVRQSPSLNRDAVERVVEAVMHSAGESGGDGFVWSEPHLTIAQLAEREGVAVQTVKSWRVRGEGPRALRLNSRIVRFPLSEVLRWEQSLMEPEGER